MNSLPPTPLTDIDTLPDGAAVITDEEIDASASGEAPVFADSDSGPSTRRPFDEEPTRKAHAPKPPKTKENTDVIDVSSWDAFKKKTEEV